jgi:MYXO-CTERM domain-containing protein
MRSLSLAALALLLPATAVATSFRLPLTECNLSGGCYVTAYFDLNRSSSSIRDWDCKTKTYDQHSGTDFGIGGFAGMDANGSRPIVAGAAGTVIATKDGLYDRNTSASGSNCASSVSCGNYVKLQHADGKVTLYCHMKRGSVAVSNGQQVSCGTVLGRVGSSGCSTGPHLHFGVNDGGGYDCPYKATPGCGGQLSYWVSQGAYNGLPAATCECTPSCSGKQCGSDGCGGSCGSCPSGTTCSGNQCVCVPQCSGKQCGSDGCGGSCGSCPSGKTCSGNQCVCAPQCGGKQCGSDGCGGSCGSCPDGTACSGDQCVCAPECEGKQCGPDGCGGSCGDCLAGTDCFEGQCVCTPQCEGKQCGPDGCGSFCGDCGEHDICTPEGLCAAPDAGTAPPDGGESDAGSADAAVDCQDGGCEAAAAIVEVSASGCGCQSATNPALWALGLALLAPLRRRGRAR